MDADRGGLKIKGQARVEKAKERHGLEVCDRALDFSTSPNAP